MAVYEVSYYPNQGRYDICIVDNYGPYLELNTIEIKEETSSVFDYYVIFIEKPTFAEAVAAASGKFLEANVGMSKSVEKTVCYGEDKFDARALLVTLIDYFRGGEPALEIARDLEVMLDGLDK